MVTVFVNLFVNCWTRGSTFEESLKDAPLNKQRPILTFASPGFMRLIDHLRNMKSDQSVDFSYCDEYRLYGLGTYSSDRNYELERDDVLRPFENEFFERMIGYVADCPF